MNSANISFFLRQEDESRRLREELLQARASHKAVQAEAQRAITQAQTQFEEKVCRVDLSTHKWTSLRQQKPNSLVGHDVICSSFLGEYRVPG